MGLEPPRRGAIRRSKEPTIRVRVRVRIDNRISEESARGVGVYRVGMVPRIGLRMGVMSSWVTSSPPFSAVSGNEETSHACKIGVTGQS